MDIEQLKLIIDTLNSLGENSKEAFIYWIIIKYGTTYLFGIIWSCIAIYLIKKVYFLLNNLSMLKDFREAAGISSYISSFDRKKICRILEKYYQNEN